MLEDFVKARKQFKEESKQKYDQLSKERLERNIEKRITTTFIGALEAFEILFGELWGQNCLRLTPEQEKMREKWKKVRTEIMDKGHKQIKTAKKELEEYNIHWNRHTITLLPMVTEDKTQKDDENE